jgi:cell shape-determining protein MreD
MWHLARCGTTLVYLVHHLVVQDDLIIRGLAFVVGLVQDSTYGTFHGLLISLELFDLLLCQYICLR